jgi:hypothetical protein
LLAHLAELATKMELSGTDPDTVKSALDQARSDNDPTPIWTQMETALAELALENQGNRSQWQCGFGYYLEDTDRVVDSCEIHPEHQELWQHRPSSGDLLLGKSFETVSTEIAAYWGVDSSVTWEGQSLLLGRYVGQYTTEEINDFLMTAELVTCELIDDLPDLS